jgi:hypothetical protein
MTMIEGMVSCGKWVKSGQVKKWGEGICHGV